MRSQAGPFYRPDDLDDLDYEEDLGDPEQYPFTRGIPNHADHNG